MSQKNSFSTISMIKIEKKSIFVIQNKNTTPMKNEIIIYQADETSTRLEVRIEDDTVWLTQAQMADLFQTSRNNITLHISNTYKSPDK